MEHTATGSATRRSLARRRSVHGFVPARWLVRLGWGSLILAAATVVLLPAGWLSVALAGLATAGLASDRRLGWLPAGLLVTIALPFGRGADWMPWTVGGYPIRPQDLAIVIAFVGATLTLLRDRAAVAERIRAPGAGAFLAASAVLLFIGFLALVGGTVADRAMRDVLRDARWWGLYLAAPLAVLGGLNRASLVRALVVGSTALAVIVVLAAIGPAVEGGLKFSALNYDRGTLRMQFGNSVFLVPAVAYAVHLSLRRLTRWRLGWLALLFAAQVLTLTRTSLVTGAVVLLVALWYAVNRRRGKSLRFSWRPIGATFLALAVGFGAAIAISEVGTPSVWVIANGTGSTPEDPLDRITFVDDQSDITVIIGSVASGGRFATYLNALRLIVDVPMTGRGFGQLVDVRFAYNQSRAHTIGKQPGVDNAYLTVALKAGAIGVAAFGGLLLLPLVGVVRQRRRALGGWFVAGWLGILALTMTQSFAVGGYAPLGVALLAALPFMGYARTSRSAAAAQR
jgi:O-antigen ligase